VFCGKKTIRKQLPDEHGANCPSTAIGTLLQNTFGVWCQNTLQKYLRYFAKYFGGIYLRYLEDKYLPKYLRYFARCLDWCFGPK
jgi:hypothetical protein